MDISSWIPLSSIYVKQGINIAGHQNRIYDTGPTWVLHLHPQGTIVSLHFVPESSTHFISTAQIECMQLDTQQGGRPITASQFLHSRQISNQAADSSGLVSNQVRHQIAEAPVYAVSGAEVLDPEPNAAPAVLSAPSISVPSDPAQNPANQREIEAKQEHLAPSDPVPAKKKRGRPRKVAPALASNGASF